MRVAQHLGDLPRGQPGLIKQGADRLPEGVEGDPRMAHPLPERHPVTVGQVRRVDVPALAVGEDRLVRVDGTQSGLTYL